MKLLSEGDVRTLLTPDTAIRAAETAFKALSTGAAEIPLRAEIVRHHPDGVILFMPGLIGERVFGLKILANRTDAAAPGGLRTTAMVAVFDAGTLAPLGMMSADYLTDYRTGAGLAAATGALARADARTLTVFGAGKLAWPAIRLICHVRPIERVIICGRTEARMQALHDRVAGDPELSLAAVESGLDPGDAAGEADVIATVTSSATPVFDGARVRPGTHINLGGAYLADRREMDDAAAARAVFFLDSRDACMARAGDVAIPLATGAIGEAQIRGEIGEVFAGTIEGRTSDDQITVFKSMGNAVQDLVIGEEVVALATQAGRGVDFNPGEGAD